MGSTRIQFFIGTVCGLAGSFATLQHITDRRLLAFPKANEESRNDFYYQTILYRRMWESNHQNSEFEVQKAARKIVNTSILSLRDAINNLSEFIQRHEPKQKDK